MEYMQTILMSTRTRSSLVFLITLYGAGCSCNESLIEGDTDGNDENVDHVDFVDSDYFTDTTELESDLALDMDIIDADIAFDPSDVDSPEDVHWDADASEPFPDPGPPDPWVPDSWDVPFDYMDIPADYLPDSEWCGNGILDPGEECDDANTNDHDECTNRCLFPRCGDGRTWYGMEECDPPGMVRPCTTSCGSTGGEWCERFCLWTGECIPPLETCGNGTDDDCDGVVDSIVRLTPNVTISAGPIEDRDATIVWTGSVFGMLWVADPDQPVLSIVDGRGRKVEWDSDLDLGSWDGLLPLEWSGSLFGVFFMDEEPDIVSARFAPLDASGSPVVPPVDLATLHGAYMKVAAFPDGYGCLFVSNEYNSTLDRWLVLWNLVSVQRDGSSIIDHGPIHEYVDGEDRFIPQRMSWTDSSFALLATHFSDVFSLENTEMLLMLVDPEGIPIGSSLLATTFPLSDYNVSDLVWTGSALAWTIGSSDLHLSFHDLAGTLVAGGSPATSHYRGGADLVWTGSDLGLAWSDDRTGTNAIYFAVESESAALSNPPARLTFTPASDPVDGYPSLAWTGSSFGVAWKDFDGIDDRIYFTHLLSCP